MKWIPVLCAMAAITPGAVAQSCPSSLSEAFRAPELERPMIVAHRACHDEAPENTAMAVRDCIRIGVEAIEIDVRLTADDQLIVFHDSTLGRMTDGYGYTFEHSLEEIRSHRLREGSGEPGAALTGLPVSTLAEVLAAAGDDLLINLEIKTDSLHGFTDVFNAAVAAVREAGALNTVFFKIPDNIVGRDRRSGSEPMISRLDLTDVQMHMPIIWYSDRPFSQRLDEFDAYQPVGFEVVIDDPQNWIEGRTDERLAGKRIMMVAVQPRWSGGYSDTVSMVDPAEGWGRLIDLGADVIMTGRPLRLQSYLDARFGPKTCMPGHSDE
ncbi:glycerophosphodiester phosphodiesterase family protein [Oceanicaulis sp.]|uniref:glycerophosphodiester phosphodiesterase family protein n=1 Tax=Oceanicaulis sp. TaxID=1924941 RepID=UPI003F728FA4